MTGSLVAEGLGFRYPGGYGFHDVSFRASAGEIACIFGQNGSGKTTLLKVLSTLIAPQAGRFSAGGFDGLADRAAVRREIFPVYDAGAHFDHLTGRENIELLLLLYGMQPPEGMDEVSGSFRLDLSRVVGGYSRGMRQKLMLVESFLCMRPVILYDEPTLGLDSAARAFFFSQARKAADSGACIIVFTNRIEDAAGADRLFRLENGTLSAVRSADEFLDGMVRVSFSYPGRVATEYIPSAADLPDLVQRMLPGGVPERIEIVSQNPVAPAPDLWTDEARRKVGRAPGALQGMITSLVERYARGAGYTRITPEVVDEARGRFERR